MCERCQELEARIEDRDAQITTLKDEKRWGEELIEIIRTEVKSITPKLITANVDNDKGAILNIIQKLGEIRGRMDVHLLT